MPILIRIKLAYATVQSCDLLLQIEALADSEQQVRDAKISFDSESIQTEVADTNGMGTLRWIEASRNFECDYEVVVDVNRSGGSIDGLIETPRKQLTGEIIPYLMPSRYCHSELFLEFVSTQFGDLKGGALIAAMRDWISENFTYSNEASNPGTTAIDSFNSLSGVCRDYAHMLITFARAAGIPARFASVYAPGVSPQDFHAVADVYLDGRWHLVDATGMSKPQDTVRICVGRDAADASFMTSYGWMDLVTQTVEVRVVAP